MYKDEKIALVLSVSIALAGFIIELIWECSNGFSRSGSLIICVGIYFGYIDLTRIYNEKFDILVAELESKRLENDIVFSDDQLKDKALRGSTDALRKDTSNVRENDEKRVALIDALILASGTLIWGFGDIALTYRCV